MYKNVFLPASMLAGTIIGAGIFSLPFVFHAYGLIAGLISLLVFALVYALVYFIYGDIVLRTDGEHRFVGYAKMYLGKPGFWAAIIIGLVQIIFVLSVYLILAPSFTRLISGGSYFVHLAVFWLIGSLMVFLSAKRIAFLEFFVVSGVLLITLLVFILGAGKLSMSEFFNLKPGLQSLGVMGPAIFALAGVMTIPEVVAYFRESVSPLKFLKRSLLLGSFLPVIAYTAFVIGVTGLSKNISEDAVSGLIGAVPEWLMVCIGVLGFLSLLSSYMTASLIVRRILEFDLHLSAGMSRFLTAILPLAIFLFGFSGFVGAISFIGSVFIPLEIILLIMIWWRVDKLRPTDDFFSRNFTRASIPVLLAIFLVVLGYVIIR